MWGMVIYVQSTTTSFRFTGLFLLITRILDSNGYVLVCLGICDLADITCCIGRQQESLPSFHYIHYVCYLRLSEKPSCGYLQVVEPDRQGHVLRQLKKSILIN